MAFGAGPGANGDRLARNGRLSCLLLLGRKCARRLGIRFRLSRCGSSVSEQPPALA
jgi:hypothetical protein